MPDHLLRLGICQPRLEYAIARNITRALELVDEAAAQGAEVVVLPEMFSTPYEPQAIRSALAHTPAALEVLQERARRHRIFLVGGSLPYDSGRTRPANRALVFDPEGKVIHQHDKMHLFDCAPPGGPVVKESAIVMPGDSADVFPTPWGPAAVIVCYDVRFTPLIQLLVDRGLRLLFVPAQFSFSTGTAHWEMLIRMRAVEIQGFVIGVQPASNEDLGYCPYGHSLAAGPWGEVLWQAGADETVAVIDLDMRRCEEIRLTFPLIAHRRTDIYRTVWQHGD